MDSSAPGWPRRLRLARHGESTGNLADRAAHEAGASRLDLDVRDADVPLSDAGRAQAQALGAWLGEQQPAPDVVLCSPYARARSTAELAVRAAGLELVAERDERLRERDLGAFDGLTSAGVRELLPDEARRRERLGKFYYRPPGGEAWTDVCLRVRSVVESLRLDHAGEDVLLVSHQAVIMCFRFVLEGLDEHQVLQLASDEPLANCGLTTYVERDGGLQLQAYNQVAPVEAGARVTAERDASADVA
ncbi:broad specificity phosphatase PhoE [Motilibacter rhizosphaerae]|uniref:phosphoglycerate mutase (2,3-diphosphoglycerate-dependent) n=1 Tax=Motilibacter rhizosphaerae TaxID=598652 RepID=A0A4Q7NST0_9ACTN|nr:histidine phosphatase family protein [Motilibacter rhizosphaerae]RZS90203.1 broad specificity phosphatase PhoE [Motilibacter rhizosphaerae]